MSEKQMAWAKKHGYDTIVKCSKCGRTQYLNFEMGLRNGWSKCCNGLTMPIIFILDKNRTVEKAVANICRVGRVEAKLNAIKAFQFIKNENSTVAIEKKRSPENK